MSMRWGKLYKGTPAELALEDAVAALGVPYRTQFPGFLYGFRFFPDFLLPTMKLVIEVDDSSHSRVDKKLADAERTEQLESMGWRVVRCTNDEALSDPRGTVRALLSSVGLWPVPRNLPRVAATLPQAARCPQKIRREMKHSERLASRAPTPPRSPPEQPPSSSPLTP